MRFACPLGKLEFQFFSSSATSILGHHTFVLSLHFVLMIPWYPSCAASKTGFLTLCGITILSPCITSWPMVQSSVFTHIPSTKEKRYSITGCPANQTCLRQKTAKSEQYAAEAVDHTSYVQYLNGERNSKQLLEACSNY